MKTGLKGGKPNKNQKVKIQKCAKNVIKDLG